MIPRAESRMTVTEKTALRAAGSALEACLRKRCLHRCLAVAVAASLEAWEMKATLIMVTEDAQEQDGARISLTTSMSPWRISTTARLPGCLCRRMSSADSAMGKALFVYCWRERSEK